MKPLRLGDVCLKIGSGATPRGGKDVYLEAGEVALIRSQNIYNDRFERNGLVFITQEHADQLRNVEIRESDVLLNITGDSVARVCQVPADVIPARVNQHVAIIRPESRRLDPKFLRFYLASPQMQTELLSLAAAGATRKALTKGMIESFEVPMVSIHVQRGIAGLLGALEDKIDLNRRMNETLEAMARAIFKDWFVDFGPTRAKAEGRAPYLAPDLWDLFPDDFNNEGVPAQWRFRTVGDCFHLTMGQSPPGRTYNDDEEGLPFFQGRTDFGFRYPKNRRYCTAPARIANCDDTLVSVRAPVGDINMAWEECCVGRGVAALRHKSRACSFTYYSAWAIQQDLKQYEQTGTVFGAINKKQFEALEVTEPTPKLVELFECHVGPLDDRIRKNVAESETLAQTRDLLLPKLMSGEIRLPDAERAVKAVV